MRATSAGPDDGRAGLGFDFGIAAGMVGMPVRVPDVGDAPAFVGGFREDCRCIRRIDRRRGAALRFVNQQAVIICQARELVDFDHRPNLSRVSVRRYWEA